MKNCLCLSILFFLFLEGHGQSRFFADRAHVTFFSDGVLEKILAKNEKVTSIFDAAKGEIAFLIRIRDFQFDKKMMQVHFNEKFMESDKYPKSTFMGQMVGYNVGKGGVQQVVASGRLFIHGVSKEVLVLGTLEMKGDKVILKSKFSVKLADYNITVPQVIWQNVSEQIEVNVNFEYSPL